MQQRDEGQLLLTRHSMPSHLLRAGLKHIGITTNGILLNKKLPELKDAGEQQHSQAQRCSLSLIAFPLAHLMPTPLTRH